MPTKLPTVEKLKAELDELSAYKIVLQAELRMIQREKKEYGIVLQNMGDLLDSTQLRPHCIIMKSKRWFQPVSYGQNIPK